MPRSPGLCPAEFGDPGQAKTFASSTTTHERSPSRQSRAFDDCRDLNRASSAEVGAERVIGST